MTQYVVLFRGINVGVTNRLSMPDLKVLLARLGCENIQTYIQSGNVVLDHASADASALAAAIKAELRSSLNVDSEVLLLTVAALKTAIDINPYAAMTADPASVHLGFLASPPPHPDLEALSKIKSASEQFQLIGSVFYLYAPDGVGRSKLAARAEKLLGVTMTDRNWRTVGKLWEMTQ
jgi:uncharacterized protein (DUF1697 family)